MFEWIRNAARFLASIEIWPVTLLVAFSMISARLLPLALGLAAGYWIVRWIATGSPSVRTPVDWPVLLLAITIPVTLWATTIPEKTLPQVYRLLTGIALFYAISNWASTEARLRLGFLGAVLAGVGLALIAPISVEWVAGKLPFMPASIYDRFTVLVADTVHPNVLAGNIVILLPCALAMILFVWHRMTWAYRAAAVTAALLMLAVLILTESRGSWLALVVVLALIVMLRWQRGWILVAAGAVATALVLYSVGISKLLEFITSSNTLGTIEGRIEVWSRAVYMIRDFPFTGVGLGSFGDVADMLYPFFSFPPQTMQHAHNLFLQVAVDLGIPGLIAWLAILVLIIYIAWRVYRHGQSLQNGWMSGIGAGILCCLAALVVHGLTDAVTWGMVRPAPLVWGLWGLAAAAGRVQVNS